MVVLIISDLDTDRDGVTDNNDKCPETRETYHFKDGDGCSDVAPVQREPIQGKPVQTKTV